MAAAAPEGTRSLHLKWSLVMGAVERIAKNGVNTGTGGGYRYTMQADVADAVRKELIKQGLTMVPESMEPVSTGVTISGKQVSILIRVSWRVTDTETGESFSLESLGMGTDSLDKAPYKAMTGSHKYALLMGLSIPTGDDPEVTNPEEKAGGAAAAESKPAGRGRGRGRQPSVTAARADDTILEAAPVGATEGDDSGLEPDFDWD